MMKLGKLHHIADPRTLKLARYATSSLAPPPPTLTLSSKVTGPLGMMGNDAHGDCVEAMAGHATQVYTALTGAQVTPTDAEILGDYHAITGWDPNNPVTDQGTAEINLLNWWRKNPIGGKSIFAFAQVEPTNHTLMMQGAALFGGLLLGVALPLTAESQSVWDVTSAPPSQNGPGTWGGHGIYCPDYNATGPVCVTWGQLKQMTWAFLDEYCDEAWVTLPSGWDGASGFDFQALEGDLLQLGVVNG